MSPKRTYWLVFVVSGLSAAVDVALSLATGATGIDTAAAAAGAVTVIYGAVVVLHDPDRARLPSNWGPLEHGVAVAGFCTVGIAFQLYAVMA